MLESCFANCKKRCMKSTLSIFENEIYTSPWAKNIQNAKPILLWARGAWASQSMKKLCPASPHTTHLPLEISTPFRHQLNFSVSECKILLALLIACSLQSDTRNFPRLYPTNSYVCVTVVGTALLGTTTLMYRRARLAFTCSIQWPIMTTNDQLRRIMINTAN
jgi:hypothetical protein